MKEELEERRVHLISKILNLDRQYVEAEVDQKTYVKRRKLLENELSTLERRIKTLSEEITALRPEEERFREYMKNGVQALLNMIINEKFSKLTPIYDLNFVTGYRYSDAEKILKEDPMKTLETLKRLSSLKILVPRFFDKIYYCPKCNSPAIQLRSLCNKCNSRNLSRAPVIEHLDCGYAGFEHEFEKNGSLVCPKCRKKLRQIGVDYSKPGYGYKCNECGIVFNTLFMRVFCTNCGGLFTQGELLEGNVYFYTLNEKLRPEIINFIVSLEPLTTFLMELNFRVEAPSIRWGVSGIEHKFDLVATKVVDKAKNIWVLEVITSSTPIKPEAVLNFYTKAFDVRADVIVLVAIPSLVKEAKIAAENYGIHFAEGENFQSALERLKELEIWTQTSE